MRLVCCEHKEFRFGARRVILDIERNNLFELDEIAARILGLLHTHPASAEELISELADSVSPEMVQETVDELAALKLVSAYEYHSDSHDIVSNEPVQTLCLLLIQDCNMRCRYCYGDGGSYGTPGQLMSLAIATQAVEFLLAQLPSRGTGNIVFFGGEPLMCWNLLKAITLYVRSREAEEQKHINLSVTTNGTLLTDAKIRFLHENQVTAAISLDGPAEIHDRMRVFANGSGSYGVILPKLLKLTQVQERLYLRATLDPKDPQITKVVDHLLQLGASLVHCEPASDMIGDKEVGLSTEEVDNLKREYHKLKDECIRIIQKEARCPPVYLFVDILRRLAQTSQRRYYGCGMGRTYLAVSADGDIFPCHRFVGQAEYCLGNLRSDLSDQLKGRFRALHVERRKPCQTCWGRYLCGGGCYYKGLITQGNVEHPDPASCEVMLEIIAAAIEIAQHLHQADFLEIDVMTKKHGEVVGHIQ